MIYRFKVAYNINGKPYTGEMTYDEKEIQMTLSRRIRTAFPEATAIKIDAIPDEQLTLPIKGAK